MKRKLILILLTVLLLGTFARAADWDFDYNGVVEEPEPTYVSGGSLQEDKGYVPVSDGCWYDYERRTFIYLAGGSEISSSVASGMVVDGEVSVKLSGGTAAYLYRDGIALSSGNQFTVTEPGAYVLSVNVNGMTQEPLKFTILNGRYSQLTSYRIPAGFYFDSATLDGENYLWIDNTLDMSREGEYRISYVCQATHVAYFLTVTVDHTAPVLGLEAVVDGVAKGPVDISDVEPGASVYVSLNGKSVPYSATLTSNGKYEVTIIDQAGNASSYNFSIQLYFNGSALAFLVLVVVMISGLVIYLIRARRSLRIR